MLKITPQTTIAELQEGPPALMQVLKSSGFYRDGDDTAVSLSQLCLSWGLNPAILLMMLEPAMAKAKPPLLDLGPFMAMPLPEFVSHIEDVYHAGLRAELDALRERLAQIEAALAD